jgi:hypothetical protein
MVADGAVAPHNGLERRSRPQVRATLWLLFLLRRVYSLAREFEAYRTGTRLDRERTASARRLTLLLNAPAGVALGHAT